MAYKLQCGKCKIFKEKTEFFPGSYSVSYCKDCIMSSRRADPKPVSTISYSVTTKNATLPEVKEIIGKTKWKVPPLLIENLLKHCQECINIIKNNEVVIGITIIFPTSKILMDSFLAQTSTEEEILEYPDFENREALYLYKFFTVEKNDEYIISAYDQSIQEIAVGSSEALFIAKWRKVDAKMAIEAAKRANMPLYESD